ALRIEHDPDRVEADLRRPRRPGGPAAHPAERQAPHARTLSAPEALERRRSACAARGLDLHEREHCAVAGDEVDLTVAAADVAVEDPKAAAREVRRGQLLTAPPRFRTMGAGGATRRPGRHASPYD